MSPSTDNPRTRPAKPALSREVIAEAALDLVGERGCAAVSMRQVAQAVDTGPASLYVYVADRDELMAAAYDLALAEVELPAEADGDWRARLELLVKRTIAELGSHHDIASVALTQVQTGPHALRISEAMLSLLRAGGVPDAACAWAADLIEQYIVSSALEWAGWLRAVERATEQDPIRAEGSRLDVVYLSLPAEEFPTINALGPLLTGSGDAATRASWKLRVIIDGLLAQSA